MGVSLTLLRTAPDQILLWGNTSRHMHSPRHGCCYHDDISHYSWQQLQALALTQARIQMLGTVTAKLISLCRQQWQEHLELLARSFNALNFWHKRVKLFVGNPTRQILTYTEAVKVSLAFFICSKKRGVEGSAHVQKGPTVP
eukprot:1160158-Pelagomonas_calceolata.AAC.10